MGMSGLFWLAWGLMLCSDFFPLGYSWIFLSIFNLFAPGVVISPDCRSRFPVCSGGGVRVSPNNTLEGAKMTDVLNLLCYCHILGVLNPPFPCWVVFPHVGAVVRKGVTALV